MSRLFIQNDKTQLMQLVADHPLASLVVLTQNADGQNQMLSCQLPLNWYSGDKHCNGDECGYLQGHLANNHRVVKALQQSSGSLQVTVSFIGAEHYISPVFYLDQEAIEQNKNEQCSRAQCSGVPTWNYQALNIYGRLSLIEDKQQTRTQIEDATAQQEQKLHAINPAHRPWVLEDAEPDFINAMLKALVGIRIDIEHFDGRFKLSQNKKPQQQRAVVNALARLAGDQSALTKSQCMAQLIAQQANQSY